MRRLSRRQVWTLVSIAWIVAAVSTVVFLYQTKWLVPFVRCDTPVADVPRAEWLVGSWSWESINPNVRYVETFANDGQWTLNAKGFTPKTSTSAWWKTMGSDEGQCAVLFLEDPRLESGPMRVFVREGPDTIREQTGDQLNHKRYTRVQNRK